MPAIAMPTSVGPYAPRKKSASVDGDPANGLESSESMIGNQQAHEKT